MVSTSNLRIVEPAANVLAFYDGRIAETRLHSVDWNWLDDAAFCLGIASYAIVDGDQAHPAAQSLGTDKASGFHH